MIHSESDLRGEGHEAHLGQSSGFCPLFVHSDSSLVLQLQRLEIRRHGNWFFYYYYFSLIIFTHPVHGNLFICHSGKISTGLKQVSQAHLLQVFIQVKVLL